MPSYYPFFLQILRTFKHPPKYIKRSSLQNSATRINTVFKYIEMAGFPPFLGIYTVSNCV